MIELADHWHQRLRADARGVWVGSERADDALVDGGAQIGRVAASELRAISDEYARDVRGSYAPPLAALVFLATGNPAALHPCFPRARALSPHARDELDALAHAVRRHDNFDLRLYDEDRHAPLPVISADLPQLVAGQLAEIFFSRQDVLAWLLDRPLSIWLYTTQRAFQQHGGVAGGCYNPAHGCVQLVASRLYEGYVASMPGVAPILHELGHLLDDSARRRGSRGGDAGLLPGLRPQDGPIFTPEARARFLEGKALELERYLRRYNGLSAPGDALPLGHPYVFQNDGEFIAGYFEMFLRNPHALAEANPALFDGFATLLRHDPRPAWPADFPDYLAANRHFYLRSGERPWPTRLTLPAS